MTVQHQPGGLSGASASEPAIDLSIDPTCSADNNPMPSQANQPKVRVVLTRPADRQKLLAQQLRQAGCDVLELPALTISPVCPTRDHGDAYTATHNPPRINPHSQSQSHTYIAPSTAIPSRTSQETDGRASNDANNPSNEMKTRAFSSAEVAKWQPDQFDALVFVSRAAWHYYQHFFLQDGWRFGALDGLVKPAVGKRSRQTQINQSAGHAAPILSCVGQSTAKQIASDLGIPLERVVYPLGGTSADSEGLWSLLQARLNSESGSEARVLIVRGQFGRDWLADTLAEHGMSVTCLSVYQREPAVWTLEQVDTLKLWAGDDGQQNLDLRSKPNTDTNTDPLAAPITGATPNANTGRWLITSGEGLAAIEQQYQLHGLTGKAGFKPQCVVVVHERLKARVRQWLNNWAAPEPNPSPKQLSNRLPSTTDSPSHRGLQFPDETPVLVVAPDDEAIAAGLLQGEEGS